MVHPWARHFSPLVPAGHQAAAFRRRNQRLVCRSNDEERVLSIRSDQLSWAGPLLRSITLAKFVWTERLGFAAAGRAGERQLRVAYIEI